MLKTFRKYYLPGIISLVGIIIIYLGNFFSQPDENSLEISFPSHEDCYTNKGQYTEGKAMKVDLSNQKLNYEQIKSSFISFNKSDSTNCLILHLKNIIYRDFIEILNQTMIHNYRLSYYLNDSIIITNTNHLKLNDISFEGQNMILPNQSLEGASYWKDPENETLNSNIQKSFWIFIPLFGMLFFYYILPFIQSKISSRQSATLL